MPRVFVRFNHGRLYHFGMKLVLPLLNGTAMLASTSGEANPGHLTRLRDSGLVGSYKGGFHAILVSFLGWTIMDSSFLTTE